jgi:hypothetical protein
MPEGKTEPAVVFQDDSHTGTDLVHFGGYPGVFMPGKKVAVTEIEFDDPKDAVDRAKELGLPLEKTTVAVGRGKMVARENHAPSDADVTPLPVTADTTAAPVTEAEAEGKPEGKDA